MVARIWHGWTKIRDASSYETLLLNEVIPGIENKKIRGFKKISIIKRFLKDEVEFITIMTFDSIESVKELAGEDYEKSYVPIKARAILSRFDDEFNYGA